MLFGQLPFSQKDTASLIKAIIFDDLTETPFHVSVMLQGIIRNCLEKNPLNRFNNLSEMTKYLESPALDFELLAKPEKKNNVNDLYIPKYVTRDEKARYQHYYFAHKFLREKLQFPKLFIENVTKPNSTFLNTYWVQSASRLELDEDVYIEPNGLVAYPINITSNHYGVLIQLPQPLKAPEAFFVAFVLREFEPNQSSEGDFRCRYLTLELGFNEDNSGRTVIGEWLPVNFHVSRKTGPNPEKELFLQEVYKIVGDGTGTITW
jgi:serine/threonine protein kinase